MALKASRFVNGFMEFKVTAVTPYSLSGGPQASLDQLPSHNFKLWIIDNAEVKDCRNNALDMFDETDGGQFRPQEIVYKIRSADEVANGGELEL
jgi:hypothetical protein